MVFPALIAPYSTVQAVKSQSGTLSLDEQGTSWQLLSTHLHERLGRALLVVERILLKAMGTDFMDEYIANLVAGHKGRTGKTKKVVHVVFQFNAPPPKREQPLRQPTLYAFSADQAYKPSMTFFLGYLTTNRRSNVRVSPGWRVKVQVTRPDSSS